MPVVGRGAKSKFGIAAGTIPINQARIQLPFHIPLPTGIADSGPIGVTKTGKIPPKIPASAALTGIKCGALPRLQGRQSPQTPAFPTPFPRKITDLGT